MSWTPQSKECVDAYGPFETWDDLISFLKKEAIPCLLYTSPSPRDQRGSRMPSSA